MKYDIFYHGTGVKVLNTITGQEGIVAEIRETQYECIEPFVRYDNRDELIRENAYNLEVINEEDKIARS